MEVQGDGIHQLQAVQIVAIFLRQQQRAAPCRIDVHPDIILGRQRGDVAQRIDSAGVGGAGGSDDRQDLFAVGFRLSDLLCQIGHVHTGVFVGFHLGHALVAQAEQRHVLLYGEVGVFRAEHL